jgi:TnpA family transposase
MVNEPICKTRAPHPLKVRPRRRTYAVGTYAHVVDQWGILYDQPIVLNRRQAGPAVEGALRQQQVDRIERVAVDTHGLTHFAMALAKLVGFDLCPRLAKLKKRKLYLPRGLHVPEVLRSCVVETVSRRAIVRGWDGLLRLATSVKTAGTPRPRRSTASVRPRLAIPSSKPATRSGSFYALFISATSSAIRRSGSKSSTSSTQGEAMHSLQRAVYNGMITAKHGRSIEELGAISRALALLANIVMAWNTHRLQRALDQTPSAYPDEVLQSIAPIGYKHINLRGILTFDLSQLGPSLPGRPMTAVQRRAAG